MGHTVVESGETLATIATALVDAAATNDYDITAPAVGDSGYQLKLISDEILGDVSSLLDGQRVLYSVGDGTSGSYGLTDSTIYTIRLSGTTDDRFWLEENGERVDLFDRDAAGATVNAGMVNLVGSLQSTGLVISSQDGKQFTASLDGTSAELQVAVGINTQADQHWTLEILKEIPNKDDEVIASSEYVTVAGNTRTRHR